MSAAVPDDPATTSKSSTELLFDDLIQKYDGYREQIKQGKPVEEIVMHTRWNHPCLEHRNRARTQKD
jgi:hypothetical protein